MHKNRSAGSIRSDLNQFQPHPSATIPPSPRQALDSRATPPNPQPHTRTFPVSNKRVLKSCHVISTGRLARPPPPLSFVSENKNARSAAVTIYIHTFIYIYVKQEVHRSIKVYEEYGNPYRRLLLGGGTGTASGRRKDEAMREMRARSV